MKKIISLLFAAIMSLCLLCGCENEEVDEWAKEKEIREKSTISELEDAYAEEMLTKDDLKDLAYHINYEVAYEGEIDEDAEWSIKARNIKIRKVYGCYSGNYVVTIETIYTTTWAVDPTSRWAEIEGVDFFYDSYDEFYVIVGNEWRKAHYDKGSLPKIEKVYKDGLLTKDDLKDLALHFNHGIAYEGEITDETELAIREDIARQCRELNAYPYQDTEADEVRIYKVYGYYSGIYIVKADLTFICYPGVVLPPRWTEIDGVDFFFGAFDDFYVCKID